MSQNPLRVEQALRLLPDVDALAPLRGFLISRSQARPALEPHGTVGKRTVDPGELKDYVPQAMAALSAHFTALMYAALSALEAEQSGDIAGVVRAFLPAGEREEDAGRYAQARQWYEQALRVAEGLRDRRPEISALWHLAHLELSRGTYEEALRLFSRSFYLADAENDPAGAALACQGMGDVAAEQGKWQGAEAWYKKGLGFAADDQARSGYLHIGLGEVARNRGLLEVAAERLGHAREMFVSRRDTKGLVQTLNAWGLLEADLGRTAEAIAAWIEALAELRRLGGDPRIEMRVRLNLCRLHLDAGHFAECEDEARRAEELAIVQNFGEQLARLYLLLGRLRGKQNDETGFVFFENAIELCQGEVASPRLQAEVYREYAAFRNAMGEREEAIAYLGRAREILEQSGDQSMLIRIENELEQMRGT